MKSLIAFTLLSLVLNLKNAHCQLTEDSCKRFANILPHKLRELRVIFNEIKDYFQAKDDELDIILLKESLLEDFKGYLGCQSVAEMIQFYLDDVLPKVTNSSSDIKQKVNFMANKLEDLRRIIKRCSADVKGLHLAEYQTQFLSGHLPEMKVQKRTLEARFLICEKNTTVDNIKETYKKLQEKGIYKAMGEFDIFVNYIEEYLITKMSH